MFFRTVAAILLSQALSCEAAVAPFARLDDLAQLPEPEQRVWSESADVDAAFAKGGQLLGDPEVDAYLQALSNRLFPDLGRAIRVRAIRDPEMNAFCMPNGSVYMNVGMLARVRNESQLATILAHEGAHFTHRHGFQQRSSLITTAAVVQGSVIGGGLVGALLGNLIGLSSIQGFSRDHEREADAVGFRRLVEARFDYRESPRVFQMLAAESVARGDKPSYFFASHPQLKERIESYGALIRDTVAGAPEPDDAAFLEIVRKVHRVWFDMELGMGRGDRLIHVLTQPGADSFYAPESSYYLGEAYRLRGGKGDQDRMLEAFRAAAAKAPRFAPTFMALGTYHYKQKDCAKARPFLVTYLDLDPTGAMSAHARRFMDKCQ